MGINVNYNPAAADVANAAFIGGAGDYQKWLAQQNLQRELQRNSIVDAQYRQEVDNAQQKYIQSTGQKFDATQNDAQRAQQQYLAQYGNYADQSGRQQQAVYSSQLSAQDNQQALQRQEMQVAAQRMAQLADAQQQAAMQQQQFSQQRGMAQYGNYAQQQQAAQQGMIQGGLSNQQFGQHLGLNQQQADLQGQQNQQQFGYQSQLQQAQFGQQASMANMQHEMQNFLGSYQGQIDPFVANQAKLQTTALQGKMYALQQYAQKNPGFETTPEYQQAMTGLTQQFTGLKSSIPDQITERQQQLQTNIRNIAMPDGSMVQAYFDGQSPPIPIENPMARLKQQQYEVKTTADVSMAKQKSAQNMAVMEMKTQFWTSRSDLNKTPEQIATEWNSFAKFMGL